MAKLPDNDTNVGIYRGLVKFFTQHPDEPLSLAEIHQALDGQIPVDRVDHVVFWFTTQDRLRARLIFLANLNASIARPRSGSSLAHTNDDVAAFYQGGAFYRTGDSPRSAVFVYDTAARWFWDPRVEEARLWNNVLPHNAQANIIDIAKNGELAGAGRKGKGIRKLTLRYDPVSTLPEGTPPPPLPVVEEGLLVEEPELPFAPSQTVELQSTETLGEALWPPGTPFTPGAAPAGLPLPPSGPEAYTQRVGAVPEVLSNDGTEGGTLVVKVNGQVIVATIKAVA